MSASSKRAERRDGFSFLNKKVLVLNKAYVPINVISVRRAIELWYNNRAEIIQEYEDIELNSGTNPKTGLRVSIKAPCIIHMYRSRVNRHAMVDTIPYKRERIFERDGGRCVYCFKELSLATFTIDHVIPQSKGGLTDWFNCRTCCSSCNSIKADKTIEELGWEKPPKVGIPTLNKKVPKNVINSIGGRIHHESWRPYIYWEFKIKD
jgi:hypothetical protein